MRFVMCAVFAVLSLALAIPATAQTCGPNGCQRPGRTSIQAMYAAPLYSPSFAPATACPAGGSCAPGACAAGACAPSCPAGACGLAYAHTHLAPAAPIYATATYQTTTYTASYGHATARGGFRPLQVIGRGLKGLLGGCCGG